MRTSLTWRRAAAVIATTTLAAGAVTGTSGTAVASPGTTTGPTTVAVPGLLDDLLDDTLQDTLRVLGLDLLSTDGGLGDTLWGDDSTREGADAVAGGTWNAANDQGSLFSLTRQVRAQEAWRSGITGRGVTVALIDTGVAPVAGLDAPGKVLNGPDLSYESQRAGTRRVDGFGHGTHMAGIIAGRDAGFDPRRPVPGTFAGVAPDAQLLSLKVATGDGGADVSQVIAAIDWVVAHRRDNGMDVRVLNLSYGTSSQQGWQVDPLAAAVENAWRAGILVVVSGGNDGAGRPLLMPAVDPTVLAVGAADHRGTAAELDDAVADFSNRGDTARRPDLLAPGKSVVSLRTPGSFADRLHPEGLVPGDAAQRYFRGSGTSQAAAALSGAAALLFQARPGLTPAQAKAVLMQTAKPLAQLDPGQGRGLVQAGPAVDLVRSSLPLPSTPAAGPASTGLGTLEASRGGEHVVDPFTGDVLRGEVDALGSPWDAAAWSTASAAGSSWSGGSFNGRTWAGAGWVGTDVEPVTWTGTSWNGTPWADYLFSDHQWESRSWRGDSWESRSWREASWLSRSWRDESFKSRSWRQAD